MEVDVDQETASVRDRRVESRLVRLLHSSRYLAGLATLSSLLGGAFLLCVGGVKTVRQIAAFMDSGAVDVLKIALIKTADVFLIGLALIIFGLGVFDLFVADFDEAQCAQVRPRWLTFRHFDDLKSILAKVIMVILMITFAEAALLGTAKLGSMWELLVVPAGAVLFAWSMRLLR